MTKPANHRRLYEAVGALVLLLLLLSPAIALAGPTYYVVGGTGTRGETLGDDKVTGHLVYRPGRAGSPNMT